MRVLRVLPISLLFLVGCDAGEQLSAQAQLTLEAISGEEEDVVEGDGDLMAGDQAARPLFRPCDAERALENVVATYDANEDGAVGPEEEGAVSEDLAGDRRGSQRRLRRWSALAFIYDADDSGDLSDAERADLLADFTERCEVLHAGILEEFDADGDGELSEDEQSAVREAREARRAERAEGHDGEGCNGEGGDPTSVAAGMTDEELAAFRAGAREAIRSGERRPFGPRDADELD